MKYHKTLSKYYQKWYEDCLESADYCVTKGYTKAAQEYLDQAAGYKRILEENREAIEFFSIGDNAFIIESAIPEQFRGEEG